MADNGLGVSRVMFWIRRPQRRFSSSGGGDCLSSVTGLILFSRSGHGYAVNQFRAREWAKLSFCVPTDSGCDFVFGLVVRLGNR